jgi:ATP-dependent RNA helicase RhlE
VTFEELNLNNPLFNSLEELGYIYATPIQTQAFPVIMSGRDVVGVAQTGTGKTFAYLLPILRLHTFSKEKHPRVLILVPTRELVVQVCNEIEKLAKYINIRSVGVYGGTNINTQKKAVQEGVDVLVATPGRLVDLVMHGSIKLSHIKKLVIDEVDEMLNLGFRTQLTTLMDLLPERKQNLLFSATLSTDVEALIADFFNKPHKIEVVPQGTPIAKIEQRLYGVPNFYTKVNLLENLIQTDPEMAKVLVFASTKKLADRLFEQISSKFPDKIGVMHSNKSQNYRLNTVKAFETGEISVLIATDIIARGLDILDVTHVVNFDIPQEATAYIHRIGRTGRADKHGAAFSFSNEVEMDRIDAIQELMGKAIPLAELPPEVEISEIFTEEEKPETHQKNYLPKPNTAKPEGGFHEKKDKNKKVNLGGSYHRKIKAKYKKPKTRGSKRK